MEMNFTDLPGEVLTHIFYFLDVSDRLSAALVCKSWLEASDTPELMGDARFIVKDNSAFELLLRSTRKFPRIHIHSLDIDQYRLTVLRRLSPHIRHLHFHRCKMFIDPDEVIDFPKLHTLEMQEEIDVLDIFRPLINLKRLNLRNVTQLTDFTFKILDEIVGPNLELFSIPNDTICEPKIINRYYSPQSSEEFPSCEILTFNFIERFIRKRALTMTDLEFPYKISGEAALRLSKMFNLVLRRASFHGCRECCNGVLPKVCQVQPLLVSINVSGVLNLSDEDVIAMCKLLPNLQQFFAGVCPQLNSCIVSLFQLKQLRDIDLNMCRISSSMFNEAIDKFEARELRSLGLARIHMQGVALERLFTLVPRLKSLDLQMCFGLPESLTDDAIFKQLPNLQELRGIVPKPRGQEKFPWPKWNKYNFLDKS